MIEADLSDYRATPTPKIIVSTLRKAPPLQRDKVFASFRGARVRWVVRFFSATVPNAWAPNIALIQATIRYAWSHMDLSVFFTLDLNEYPELQHALAGQRMVVYGTVVSSSYDVTLDLARLELLPARFWDRWIQF